MTSTGPSVSDQPSDIIKKYWDDFSGGGKLPPVSPGKGQRRPALPASFSGARQVAATEDFTAAAKLHLDLVAAREARAKATAEVTVLKARITQLEAQLTAQSKVAQAAREAVREARGRWTGGGFVGGCLVTVGVIGGFVVYFTSFLRLVFSTVVPKSGWPG